MTREELKVHCEKQVERCQMWAKHNGEEPSGKIYEEHKLILELLEQGSILDKIKDEIDGIELSGYIDDHTMFIRTAEQVKNIVLVIINKYRNEANE